MRHIATQYRKLISALLVGIATATALPGLAAAELEFTHYTTMVACATPSSPPPMMVINGSILKPDRTVRFAEGSFVGIDLADSERKKKGDIDELCFMANEVKDHVFDVVVPATMPPSPPGTQAPPASPACMTTDNDGDGETCTTCTYDDFISYQGDPDECRGGGDDVITSEPAEPMVCETTDDDGDGVSCETCRNDMYITTRGDCGEDVLVGGNDGGDNCYTVDTGANITWFGRECTCCVEDVGGGYATVCSGDCGGIPSYSPIPKYELTISGKLLESVGYLNPQPEPPGVGLDPL